MDRFEVAMHPWARFIHDDIVLVIGFDTCIQPVVIVFMPHKPRFRRVNKINIYFAGKKSQLLLSRRCCYLYRYSCGDRVKEKKFEWMNPFFSFSGGVSHFFVWMWKQADEMTRSWVKNGKYVIYCCSRGERKLHEGRRTFRLRSIVPVNETIIITNK